MSRIFPFTTHRARRVVFGALSILAIAPVLYFAACSSGGDDGGGGGSTPPSNNTPTGSANQFAYVIASGASEIQAFSLDNSGNLTKIGGPIATGVNPHHVDVDRTGRFVYVSNHDSSFVSGWRINTDGSLDPMNPATGSPVLTADVGPHSSVIDQTGSFLYVVSGTGASTIKAYTIDTSTGPTRGMPTAIAGQSFPVGTHGHNVTISPNNLFIYVAAETSGEVYAFSRDTTSGALTAQGVMTGLPNCDAVAVSPDNKFLYAAYTNAVEVFSIAANGALTRITPVSAFSTNNAGQGSGPHSMTIHPNGQTLYTANINANTVSVFRVDTATGALTELQTPPPATGTFPNYVLVHPNQLFLFTADQGPGALSRFGINADGKLTTPATVIPNTGVGTNGIGTTKF
jgi:6-phosphogluconolactonase (cycloisomerase 2 family)